MEKSYIYCDDDDKIVPLKITETAPTESMPIDNDEDNGGTKWSCPECTFLNSDTIVYLLCRNYSLRQSAQ